MRESIHELWVYQPNMLKSNLSLVFFFLVGCQDFNSNSFDKLRYAPAVPSGSTEFQQAYGVIQNRCISCHTGRHGAWAGLRTEAQWIDSGLIVPNSPDNSALIRSIVNSNAPGANMPPSGALSDQEYQTLRRWIENITP